MEVTWHTCPYCNAFKDIGESRQNSYVICKHCKNKLRIIHDRSRLEDDGSNCCDSECLVYDHWYLKKVNKRVKNNEQKAKY